VTGTFLKKGHGYIFWNRPLSGVDKQGEYREFIKDGKDKKYLSPFCHLFKYLHFPENLIL